MSEQIKKLQDQLEQMLKEVENNPSLCVEMSDAELAKIVGGAIATAQPQNGEVCTCPERCCGQHRPGPYYLCSRTLKK